MALVERAIGRAAAVTRGSERHALCAHSRIGMNGVVIGDQTRRIDEAGGFRRLTCKRADGHGLASAIVWNYSIIMPDSGSQLLLEARLDRVRLHELPADSRPTTAPEAYQCQTRLIEGLNAHDGGHCIGYKIACTNAVAQRFLKMPEPFYGRLLPVPLST